MDKIQMQEPAVATYAAEEIGFVAVCSVISPSTA